MKKRILSVLIAIMLVAPASITAYCATASDVKSIIDSAVSYLYGEKEGFSIDESKEFNMYLASGADASAFKDGWCNSVKNALDSNALLSISDVAIILSNMDYLSLDETDFEGYNLVEIFEETALSEYDNAYLDLYVTNIASRYGIDELGRQVCDRLVEKYTIGEGTDFWGGWGTSPDDLGAFIIALSAYYDEYQEYIDDAISLLLTYNTDEGYDNFGANADSTAYALSAFSAVADKEKADDAYQKLMLFYDEEQGCFIGSWDNDYATSDAVFALEYYLSVADDNSADDSEQNLDDADEPQFVISTEEIDKDGAVADDNSADDSEQNFDDADEPQFVISTEEIDKDGAVADDIDAEADNGEEIISVMDNATYNGSEEKAPSTGNHTSSYILCIGAISSALFGCAVLLVRKKEKQASSVQSKAF